MQVLVVGGTGLISSNIVQQLVAQQHDVTIVSRGVRKVPDSKVETVVADKSDRESFRKQMDGRSFDAVIDMISFNRSDVETTIETFGDKTGHIVVCSTVAAYRRPYNTVPVEESAEHLREEPSFGYGFHKAEMERAAQSAWQERAIPITIIRPSLTFGVGAANMGTFRQNAGIVHRIREGKPLVVPGDGVHSWSFTFAPDVARAFVGVLGNRQTFGEAYHATSEERTIWMDLYLTFGRLIGKEPELVHIPSKYLMEAAPETCAHLYFEKSYDGLFSNDKLRSVLPNYRAEISLEQGLAEILDWWDRTGAQVDRGKDRIEDALVAEVRQLRDRLPKAFE